MGLGTYRKATLLGLVPFLDFNMTQGNPAQAFLDYYIEVEDKVPQILKESCCDRMESLKPMNVLPRGDGKLCSQLKMRIWGTTGLGFCL